MLPSLTPIMSLPLGWKLVDVLSGSNTVTLSPLRLPGDLLIVQTCSIGRGGNSFPSWPGASVITAYSASNSVNGNFIPYHGRWWHAYRISTAGDVGSFNVPGSSSRMWYSLCLRYSVPLINLKSRSSSGSTSTTNYVWTVPAYAASPRDATIIVGGSIGTVGNASFTYDPVHDVVGQWGYAIAGYGLRTSEVRITGPGVQTIFNGGVSGAAKSMARLTFSTVGDGLPAYYSATITAGSSLLVGVSPTTYRIGYQSPGLGDISSPSGPLTMLFFTATGSNPDNGISREIGFSGNQVAALAGKSVYVDGVRYPFQNDWAHNTSPYSYTRGVWGGESTGPLLVNGGSYYIEIK